PCIVRGMKTLVAASSLALLLAGGACKKDTPEAPAAEAPPADEATAAARAKADEDAAKKADELARVRAAMTTLEEDVAKESARWTDDLKKKTAALRARSFKNTKSALAAILPSEHRSPGNAARDPQRHPTETLEFFDVRPGMTVLEMGSGAGWCTGILSPLVGPKAKLIVMAPPADGPADSMRTVYGKRAQMTLAKAPELYSGVELLSFDPPEDADLGVEGVADRVLAIREMHGWARRDVVDAYLGAAHAALK